MSSIQTYGTDATVYSSGAKLQAGAALFFTAGGLAPADRKYADLKEEALATIEELKRTIAKAGFTLSDVVFARAYLVPDASGKVDFAGWNAAWNTVFNNPSHPHKPARSTVAIPLLALASARIEVEFVCASSSGAKISAGSSALGLPVTNGRLSPYGTREARIYGAMGVAPGTGLYWTAGMLKKKDTPPAAKGESETYVQAKSTLENLAGNLANVGLSFQDVVFLRAFVAPDPASGKCDFDGWNRAYLEFFNHPKNPHKPARTTVTTPSFGATPALLIEIEVIAAFPEPPALFAEPDPKNPNLRTYGAPEAQIASGVAAKGGASLYFSSGAVSAVPGDMKTQALSALGKLKESLAAAGLGFKDVIFLRAYITPEADGSLDRAGWSEAYHTCFNFPGQPHKPARTTIAVHSLPKPEWKIEIDVIAAAP